MSTHAHPHSLGLLFALLATPLLSNAQVSNQAVLSAIPFIGYDNFAAGPQIDASIIGVQDSTTTMALACAPGTDASDCGLAPVQALIYGPSTYLMAMSDGTDVGTQDCVLAGTTAPATCMEFATGGGANDPGSSTTTYEPTDVQLVPVTVTAGAELLAGATATAGAAVSSSAALTTLTSASSTSTTVATVGTTSAARSSTASVSAASTSSTGAASRYLGPGAGSVAGALFGLVGYFIV